MNTCSLNHIKTGIVNSKSLELFNLQFSFTGIKLRNNRIMDKDESQSLLNVINMEGDITSDFLSGNMSFVEYSKKWYGYGGSDEVDDDDEDEVDEDEDDKPSSSINKSDRSNLSTLGEKRHRRSRYTRLSPALLGLMGEANLRFARGDKEAAEMMCQEIIKQVAGAPEPYQTLAQIYEHDTEKSLQFALLAAHLSPPDKMEWLRLAAVCKELNNPKQESICYTRAIKADPTDLEVHLKRLSLLESLESINYPLNQIRTLSKVKCYHTIVKSLLAKDGEHIMKYARLAVAVYQNGNELERAAEVMETAYEKCASLFTAQDSNFFLEILMNLNRFDHCLEVFVALTGVDVEAEIQTVECADGTVEEQTRYLECSTPSNMPIDLKCKLIICFINLGSMCIVEKLLNDFLTSDVEQAGDLFIDIEEALSASNQHELALKLLEPLIKHSKYNLGAVWLKYADCLFRLGKDDGAIDAYNKVLVLAPQNPEARKSLFAILEKRGCKNEAIAALQQDYKYVLSASVLYEQCKVYKESIMEEKYLEVGEALLSKTFMKFKHHEELALALRSKGAVELIHDFRKIRGIPIHGENDLQFDENDPFALSPEEEWELFLDLLKVAKNLKKYYVMERLSYGAMTSKNLTSHKAEIEFYILQSCILNGDYYGAFRFIRDYCYKYKNNATWNLLNFICCNMDQSVPGKHYNRIFDKNENIVRLVLVGTNFLISGRYLIALKYFLEYHNQHKEPLSALLISVTILAMAAQRTVDKHHHLVLEATTYLNHYKSLRKCAQEVNYNMGRTFQMLSINNIAIEFYERALKCPTGIVCKHHGPIDLTKESAYNLYILYKEHSPQVAQKYLHQYLII